jgi:cell division protein FtsL
VNVVPVCQQCKYKKRQAKTLVKIEKFLYFSIAMYHLNLTLLLHFFFREAKQTVLKEMTRRESVHQEQRAHKEVVGLQSLTIIF